MLVIAGKSCFQQQKWQERESLPFQLLFAHLNPSMNVKQHCCSAHCFLLQLLIMYEYEDYKKLVFLSSYFLFITKLCKKKLKQVKCKHFQPLHTQNRAEGIEHKAPCWVLGTMEMENSAYEITWLTLFHTRYISIRTFPYTQPSFFTDLKENRRQIILYTTLPLPLSSWWWRR